MFIGFRYIYVHHGFMERRNLGYQYRGLNFYRSTQPTESAFGFLIIKLMLCYNLVKKFNGTLT